MELRTRVDARRVARAPVERVYAVLADVPRSIAHFPDVVSVVEVDGAWHWHLRELGAGPIRHQVRYANRYFCDAAALRVWWEPVAGFGNASVRGRWVLTPGRDGTELRMDAEFQTTAPFPALLRSAVERVVAHENDRLTGLYLQNLVVTIEGGDGRVR